MVKLLVVDDDAFVRIMISLDLPEVELVEARSVGDGYELALAERPDAIVVDRRLPGGDGLQLVRRLRQNFATYRIPIVVLTAGYDPADHQEVTAAGADDYLGKPFEVDALFARIQRLLALPGADLRPRRSAIVETLRAGLPLEIDLTDGDEIDLTDAAAAESRRRWWRRRSVAG